MRISDWSSDVCSSDLLPVETRGPARLPRQGPDLFRACDRRLPRAGPFRPDGSRGLLDRRGRIDDRPHLAPHAKGARTERYLAHRRIEPEPSAPRRESPPPREASLGCARRIRTIARTCSQAPTPRQHESGEGGKQSVSGTETYVPEELG